MVLTGENRSTCRKIYGSDVLSTTNFSSCLTGNAVRLHYDSTRMLTKIIAVYVENHVTHTNTLSSQNEFFF